MFSMLEEMIDAAGAEPAGAFEFARGGLWLGQRNGADPGEPISVVRTPRRQRVVEHPVPGDARVGGKAIAEDVRPGADDLDDRCPAGRAM